MNKQQLKQIIKECIRESLETGDKQAKFPSFSSYGKHDIYDGEFSSDYLKLYKLEKSINRLPRKIGNRSISALFVDTAKPFQMKNPMVEIKFQMGSATRKIYMTLKEWNKNNDMFVLSKEGGVKGKKIEIPEILLTQGASTKQILEQLLGWMKGSTNNQFIPRYNDDDNLDGGGSEGEW